MENDELPYSEYAGSGREWRGFYLFQMYIGTGKDLQKFLLRKRFSQAKTNVYFFKLMFPGEELVPAEIVFLPARTAA